MTETRQHKIDRIYEVIKPTIFWNTDLDSWHSNWDIKCVMIWDVLDYFNEDIYPTTYTDHHWDTCPDMKWENSLWVINHRKEKRKSIGGQPDNCIDYIYSLLPQDEQRK